MKNVIIFLTFRPTFSYYNLCKNLCHPNYLMYIFVDDNSYDIPGYDGTIPIIKVDNKECEDHGFKDCGLLFRHKAYSRDKALYYFYKNNIEYDNIWLLEDDVFVPTPLTIPKIDEKYGNDDDLLVASHDIHQDDEGWWWWYIKDTIYLPFPWAKAMICAIKISKKLVGCIGDYAQKNGTLFMDEALFNTLALYHNLKIKPIPELSTIEFRYNWVLGNINPDNLYHPIKNINVQSIFTKMIELELESLLCHNSSSQINDTTITEQIHIKQMVLKNKRFVSKNTTSEEIFSDTVKKIYFKINTLDPKISVRYGTDNYKINITTKFINSFVQSNKIIIPKKTKFNDYFGDPCNFQVKKIFLRIDEIEFIIGEYANGKDLEFDINIVNIIDMDCNNILAYYETDDVKINITDDFIDELKKNNCIKNIFIKIYDIDYIFDNDISNNLVLSDPVSKDIIAYYGKDNSKINITSRFIKEFVEGNKIIIPKDSIFNMHFGDPCPTHLKQLFLIINKTEYIINEYRIFGDIEFDIGTKY